MRTALLELGNWLARHCDMIVTALLTFFLPIQPLVLTIGCFVFADTLVGVIKAHKMGQPITSRGFRALSIKSFFYIGFVLLMFVLDKNILNDLVKIVFSVDFLLTKIASLIVIYTEVKSMDESLQIMTGLNVYGQFKKLIKLAKDTKDDISKLK